MIRKGELKDLPDVCRLGFQEWMLEKGYLTGVDWSLQTTWNRLLDVIRNPALGELFVAEDENRVVGFMLAHYVPFPTDVRPVCHEVGWFVDEAYRGRGHGFRLKAAVEAAAREKGVFAMSLGVSLNVEGKEALLEKYQEDGYVPFQMMAFKVLKKEKENVDR